MPEPLKDFSRLCLHTITNQPLKIGEALELYQEKGIPSVTFWRRDWEEGPGIQQAAKLIKESGLNVVSACRGGFFPAIDIAGRQAAIDDNKRIIDEAQTIGAPLVVLVCGAVPGQPLEESRKQIADGIAACLDHARQAGVKLSIEPLHPMYADDRSAVNTLGQANDIAESIDDEMVGVTVDVYHLWWDPDLEKEIKRCGKKNLFSFHVCDWRSPTRDLLLDRGMMGEGCIPIRQIRGWVEETGFDGPIEVEIFSNEYWSGDQELFVDKIKTAYKKHV